MKGPMKAMKQPLLDRGSSVQAEGVPIEGTVQTIRDFFFTSPARVSDVACDDPPNSVDGQVGVNPASAPEYRLAHQACAGDEDPLLTWIHRHKDDHAALFGGTIIPTGSCGFTLKNGSVGILASGRRRIWDVQKRLLRIEEINCNLIEMGQVTIVRVRPGEIGLALRHGKPVILEEGRHILAAPEWAYVGVANAADDVVSWQECAAVKIVRVRPGRVAFIREAGVPRVLLSRERPYELLAPQTVLVKLCELNGSGSRSADVLRFDEEGSLDLVRVRPGNVALAWHNGSPQVLGAARERYELRAPEWQFVKLGDLISEHIALDAHNSLDIVRVLPGKLGLCYEGGQPRILQPAPEPYVLCKPQSQFIRLEEQHTEHIALGSLHIITISTGRRGVIWIRSQAQILEEGQAVFNDGNFEFGGSSDMGEKDYTLGPFRFVTVDSGEVGKKFTCGKLAILEPGTHRISTAEGETFQGFVSVQQRVMKVAQLNVTTLDNVELHVDAVLTWSICNAERAIRDVESLDDVLRQRTETTLSTIFSHINYSEKAMPPPLSAAHASDAVLTTARAATAAAAASSEDALSTKVHREFMGAIQRTAEDDWGVRIGDLSVDNIVIANKDLASDLKRRAVITVQTDTARANAENAKVVNLIEADALAQKRVLEAKAETAKAVATAKANAEVTRAEAEAEADAARIVAEGNANALRIMSAAEAEAKVTMAQAERTATELEAEGAGKLGDNALRVRQWGVQAQMVKDMYQHQRTFIDTSQMPTMAQMLNMKLAGSLGGAFGFEPRADGDDAKT